MNNFDVDRIDYDGGYFYSDSIETVAYDRESKTLFVEFKGSVGSAYAYKGVEESTYNLLITAPSLNHFWRNHISGEYTSTKYENVDFDKRPAPQPVKVDVDTAEVVSVPKDTASGDNYGVRYHVTGKGLPQGQHEASFSASDETDALRQFNDAISSMEKLMGWELTIVIKAVTHYLD